MKLTHFGSIATCGWSPARQNAPTLHRRANGGPGSPPESRPPVQTSFSPPTRELRVALPEGHARVGTHHPLSIQRVDEDRARRRGCGSSRSSWCSKMRVRDRDLGDSPQLLESGDRGVVEVERRSPRARCRRGGLPTQEGARWPSPHAAGLGIDREEAGLFLLDGVLVLALHRLPGRPGLAIRLAAVLPVMLTGSGRCSRERGRAAWVLHFRRCDAEAQPTPRPPVGALPRRRRTGPRRRGPRRRPRPGGRPTSVGSRSHR